MEMSMTYQPSRDVFPSGIVSLQEKMRRLQQEISDAQHYRLQLDREAGAQGEAGPTGKFDSASSLKVEKQITDLRISEMQARLTALLDRYCD
jgi:hypothetical protein